MRKKETIGTDTYDIEHFFNTIECYEMVKIYAEKYWNPKNQKINYENYEFENSAKPWALGPMLENGSFEHGFSVLSINDIPWSFAGIRKYNEETALIMCRNFCFHTNKPVTYGLLLPFQLELSKELGYKYAWLTLNSYNLKIFNTVWGNLTNKAKKHTDNRLYENSLKCVLSSQNLGIKNINYTEQHVISWTL